MKKVFYIILLLVTLSCNDALFNAGDVVTLEVETSDFKEIYINDIFNVFLIQDDTCKIEIKGGQNLLPDIDFEVDDDKKLTISDNNNARWSRDYDKIEIYISVDTLNFLRLNAPCKVVSQNTLTTHNFKIWSITDFAEYDLMIDCENFNLVNNSSSGGIANVQGEATNSTFWARGSFQINAENLMVNKLKIRNESMANCTIHVTESLNVEILRDGKVYYKGNPEIIDYVNERARDQLIKLD